MKHLSPALTILVLILAVLTFANCKSSAPEKADHSEVETTISADKSSTDEDAVSELADTAWIIQQIDDQSVIEAPDAATLEFLADGQLAGNASCNRMMGSYKHGDADGEISFELGGLTMMMCPDELMEQEKNLLAMLPKITSYVRDGAFLTLQTEDEKTITARLMDEKPSAELVGEEWFIEDIDGKGVIDDSPASIMFSSDGKVSGNGSCNRMMGSFEKGEEEDELTIEMAGTTKMMCPEALMNQETSLLEILSKITSYDIDDTGTLTLKTEDGKTVTARLR